MSVEHGEELARGPHRHVVGEKRALALRRPPDPALDNVLSDGRLDDGLVDVRAGRTELWPERVEVRLGDVEHGAEAEELGAFRTLHGRHGQGRPGCIISRVRLGSSLRFNSDQDLIEMLKGGRQH